MREVVKLGLVLFIITAVAAVVLAVSNNATSDMIAKVQNEANDAARREVLPQAESFKIIDESKMNEIKSKNGNILEVFIGISKDKSIVGYTIKTATSGYGGNVEVITGISLEGKITGIKVVKHQETPGLGANSTKPEFQSQFNDKSTDKELIVVKTGAKEVNEIQALTGATITSRSVTTGVNSAISIYNEYLSD